MRKQEGVYRWAVEVIAWGGRVAISLMVALVTLEVIVRKFFRFSLVGTVEMVSALMVVVVYLALSYTESKRAHVQVDLLVSRLGHRTQLVLDIVISFLVLGIYSTIIWQSWQYALDAWHVGLLYQTAKIPVFPFRAVVPIGIFFFCVLVGLRLAATISKLLGMSRG